MAQTIIGLDIGSHSLKVVRLEARRGTDFEVIDFDEVALLPGTPDELLERQEVALRELETRGKLVGDLIVTGLPGDVAAARTLRFPFSDARKIEQTLPFEIEAEVPFDLEDIVLTWTILGEVLDDEGNKLTEVLVAYARRDAVEAHLALLETAGLDPRHVVYQPFVIASLFDGVFKDAHGEALEATGTARTPGGTVIQLGADGAEPAIAIVDIGRRATTVTILTADRVLGGHTILHGGDDATRALARELALPLEEAERGKRKEAFIEVTGARAQFPQQTQISDILKQAYAPIGRRLRQLFQGELSKHRTRVVKVILTGGGSRIINLERHLAEVLNVRVARGHEISGVLGGALPIADSTDAPQVAVALSYALAGFYGPKTRGLLDLRTGEFAWRGELDFLREKAISFGVWAGVMALALIISGGAQAWVLGSEESELRDRQLEACKTITKQDIESPTRCLAIIQETIGKQTETGIPVWSAVDTYLEVSKRVPQSEVLQRRVSELDINNERVRMKATTSDFDAVDKMVTALQAGKCFHEVEKGKARNTKDGVEFNVVIRLDCDAAKGEAEPSWIAQVAKGPVAPKGKARPTVKKPIDRKALLGRSPLSRKLANPATREAVVEDTVADAAERAERAAEAAKKREERREQWEERKRAARERAREKAMERAKENMAVSPEERLDKMRARGFEPFKGVSKKLDPKFKEVVDEEEDDEKEEVEE